MGVLTDYTRRTASPLSCDGSNSRSRSRSRLISHHSDCTEVAHRNKRVKKHPLSPLSCVEIAFVSESKPKFELPPPSRLARAVQGPHRPTMPQLARVSDLELEEEWMMKHRCYETATDFKALENYKRRVASLQANFAYPSPNYYDAYSRGLEPEQEEGERSAIDFDSGRPSSTPIMVDERERERERERGKEKEEQGEKSQPEYIRLYENIKRERVFKLKVLEMEIELASAKLEALQFTKDKDKDKEKEDQDESLSEEEKLVALHDALAPLKDEEEAHVACVFKGRNREEVLVMHDSSNIEITREILQCLLPGAWLNDEVINLYFELLKERAKREPKKFLKCHFFNTFFYKKLYNKTKYDYKAVRRWTTQRKIGYSLTDCDKIFVPIHKEIHWCLAIIDMRAKKFQYLDSLKGSDAYVLQVLARYIVDETKDKMGQDLDVSTWEQEYVNELPAQENGSDCGVFMIKYADFHSRGLPLSFSQANMPYFRKRTVKEILGLRAE